MVERSRNHGTPPTPVQDDEAAATIDPPGSLLLQQVDNQPLGISIKAYPNPSDGPLQLDIEAAETQSCNIQLVTLEGKTMWQQRIELLAGSNQYHFDIAHLPTGTYVLYAQNSDGTAHRQLLVKR